MSAAAPAQLDTDAWTFRIDGMVGAAKKWPGRPPNKLHHQNVSATVDGLQHVSLG
jgi:hypothetical protein